MQVAQRQRPENQHVQRTRQRVVLLCLASHTKNSRLQNEITRVKLAAWTAQSSCQRRYAPTVFGIIPECRSASIRKRVHLRRNPRLLAQKARLLRVVWL